MFPSPLVGGVMVCLLTPLVVTVVVPVVVAAVGVVVVDVDWTVVSFGVVR